MARKRGRRPRRFEPVLPGTGEEKIDPAELLDMLSEVLGIELPIDIRRGGEPSREQQSLDAADTVITRFRHLDLLVTAGRFDAARDLCAAHRDEPFSGWAYSRALVEFAGAGDTPKARRLLEESRCRPTGSCCGSPRASSTPRRRSATTWSPTSCIENRRNPGSSERPQQYDHRDDRGLEREVVAVAQPNDALMIAAGIEPLDFIKCVRATHAATEAFPGLAHPTAS